MPVAKSVYDRKSNEDEMYGLRRSSRFVLVRLRASTSIGLKRISQILAKSHLGFDFLIWSQIRAKLRGRWSGL